MKYIAFAVCSAILVSGIAVWPQTTTQPLSQYKEFEAWGGNWTFRGEARDTPSGPAYKLDWSWQAGMRPGGYFLEGHGVLRGPDSEDRYLEIIGYDPGKKAYVGYVFHDSGVMEIYTMIFDGRTCAENGQDRSADGKITKWWHVWTFSPDRMSVSGKCEAETDGIRWTAFEVKGVRSPEK